MSDPTSATPWIKGIAAGGEPNVAARNKLCEELFERCVGLARKKLQGHAIGEGDGTDVAVSAFRTFFRRAKECKFSDLQDQNHLLNLLLELTAFKAADLKNKPKKEKEGGGGVAGGNALEKDEGVKKKPDYRPARGSGQEKMCPLLPDSEIEPELDLMGVLNDECRRLLDLLDNGLDAANLREIAIWKLEGYTTEEIAKKLKLNDAAIYRKVARIKERWEREKIS